MFSSIQRYRQRVLGFACSTCPLFFSGRCEGSFNAKAYHLNDPSVFPCIDPTRRELGFADVYDRVTAIPVTSLQDRIKLPIYVPLVKSGLNLRACTHVPVFGISIQYILSVDGNLLFDSVDEIKRRCRLPANSKLVLIGVAKDKFLEALWRNSYNFDIWKRIARMGFEWSTSMSFSVWDVSPRADQIIRQERNFLTHDYFVNAGLPSIPFVYPFDDSDYRAFGRWMSQRPDINTVAVLGRYYKTDNQFAMFRQNMRLIQDYAKRHLRFLVVSVAKRSRFDAVTTEFEATIVNGKAFFSAVAGRFYDGEINEKDLRYTPDELAYRNFDPLIWKRHEISASNPPFRNIRPVATVQI